VDEQAGALLSRWIVCFRPERTILRGSVLVST
jgi:hypothetical protein